MVRSALDGVRALEQAGAKGGGNQGEPTHCVPGQAGARRHDLLGRCRPGHDLCAASRTRVIRHTAPTCSSLAVVVVVVVAAVAACSPPAGVLTTTPLAAGSPHCCSNVSVACRPRAATCALCMRERQSTCCQATAPTARRPLFHRPQGHNSHGPATSELLHHTSIVTTPVALLIELGVQLPGQPLTALEGARHRLQRPVARVPERPAAEGDEPLYSLYCKF